MKKYFISFVEECVLNPDFAGCIGGRVEITWEDDNWPCAELRFLTKKIEQFEQFREQWDFKVVTQDELGRIEASLKTMFNDGDACREVS